MNRRRDEPGRVRTVRHEVSLKTLLMLLALLAGLWLLARLWPVLVLLMVALILAGTLAPALDWLEGHRVRRAPALALLLLALALALAGLGALIVPALAGQVADLVAGAPALQQRLADAVARVRPLAPVARAIRAADLGRSLAPLGRAALDYTPTAAGMLLNGLTAVVLACYLLADRERVQGFAFALLPRRFHLRAARLLLGLETVVGGYVRGQAITSFLIAAVTCALLLGLRAPHALAIGTVVGFADLIPYLGSVVATALPVAAALPRGLLPAAIVLVALVAYQQLENQVIVPRVYGQTLRLAPVAVVLALLVGGALFGVAGALLALPVAAGIRVAVEEFRIELPGDQPAEAARRARDARAEASYARATEGFSAVEAAAVATELAAELQGKAAPAHPTHLAGGNGGTGARPDPARPGAQPRGPR